MLEQGGKIPLLWSIIPVLCPREASGTGLQGSGDIFPIFRSVPFYWASAHCSLGFLILKDRSGVLLFYPNFIRVQHVIVLSNFFIGIMSSMMIWISIAFLSAQTSLASSNFPWHLQTARYFRPSHSQDFFLLLFSHHSLWTLETAGWKFQKISSFWNPQPSLSWPDHILIFNVKNNWSSCFLVSARLAN